MRYTVFGLTRCVVAGVVFALASCATRITPVPVPVDLLTEAPEPAATSLRTEIVLPVAPVRPLPRAEAEAPVSLGPVAPVVSLPRAGEVGRDLPQPSVTPDTPVVLPAASRVVESAQPVPPAPRVTAAPAPPAASNASTASTAQAAVTPRATTPAPSATAPRSTGVGAAVTTPLRGTTPAPAVAATAPTVAPATTRSTAVAPVPAAPVAAPVVPAAAIPAAVDTTVLAREGDEVEIALPGEGWVLLGFQPVTARLGATGLEFIRRQLGRESTAFAFRAKSVGDYRATFQRQELATGLLQGRRVLVRVVTAADYPAQLAAAGEDTAPGAAAAPSASLAPLPTGSTGVLPSTKRQAADRLYALGLYDSALAEYQKIASTGAPEPEVLARIAEIQERRGNTAAAARGWAGLTGEAGLEELALAGLVRTSASLGDTEAVEANLDSLLRISGFGVGRELVAVARYAQRLGRNALELEVLEEYLRRYPSGEQADEVYYLLGGLLEKAWEGRDLARSLESYGTVLRLYPTSVYNLPSSERVDYLKRHFFLVR